MAKINVNPNNGKPAWDFQYMKECMTVQSAVAYQRYGVTQDGNHQEWVSAHLRAIIEQRPKYAAACRRHATEAVLQTRTAEIMKNKTSC